VRNRRPDNMTFNTNEEIDSFTTLRHGGDCVFIEFKNSQNHTIGTIGQEPSAKPDSTYT